jgi:predicted secreted protein
VSATHPAVARFDAARVARLYILALGAGLLVEGGGLLLVQVLAIPLPVGTNDTRHNLLHVVWGIALIAIAVTSRGRTASRATWAAVVFGVFYVALGVLGLVVDRPFGLLLGPGENAFHFIVGPLALLLGLLALSRSAQRSGGVSSSASSSL